MADLVHVTRHADVAVIRFNNPPVNALSTEVQEGLQSSLHTAAGDSRVRAVVVTGGGRTFCAGADIHEFGEIASGEKPLEKLLPLSFMEAIEDCAKPVVMAIRGSALGGGLELAMAGHYRVIEPSAKVGQTEVKLGLIPGAGGTQRLPRLAGVAKAVDMCAFGESITAQEALAHGIVDRLIEGDLVAGAIKFAREMARNPIPRTRERDEKLREADPAVFTSARERARKTRRGQMAPLAAVDAVEAATTLSFEEGCRREAELFRGCVFSSQSKAMIHAFFGERAVSKIPDVPGDTATLDIRLAAIVGAGTMGGGIAMALANAGIPVTIKEASQKALDAGMATVRKNYAGSVKKGAFTKTVADERLARIKPQLTYDGFESADVIVEAVFEDMAVKKRVFGEIDRIAKPECILASNTSTLDIDEMASATKRPESVIGLHFFSPANVMRLLEIIRGGKTSNEVIATSMALAKRLKKVGVLARNSRGFIGSRMMEPYWREAEFLVEEGASVEEVNQTLYDFGMAMGPLAMADLVGLDVAWHIRQVFKETAKPGVRQPRVIDLLHKAGRFGQKTGSGWSKYDENRKASPDPETEALIEKAAGKAAITRRQITREEILDRCIYGLVNEGTKLLEEGVALRAEDIDVVYLTGYGFPVWRGGPMFYADSVGLKTVLARIEEFERQHGSDLWAPAPLLKKLAESGGTFTSGEAAAAPRREKPEGRAPRRNPRVHTFRRV